MTEREPSLSIDEIRALVVETRTEEVQRVGQFASECLTSAHDRAVISRYVLSRLLTIRAIAQRPADGGDGE